MILKILRKAFNFFTGLFTGLYLSFQLFQENWDSPMDDFIGTFSLAIASFFLISSLFINYKFDNTGNG